MSINTTTTHPLVLAAAAAGFVALGAAAMWFGARPGVPASPPVDIGNMAAPTGAAPSVGPTPDDEVTITLADDVVARAGIRTATIGNDADVGGLIQVPGVIEADAYATVAVTPLVAGRVTAVAVALGDHVRRGETLASVFSPTLADAQAQYVSGRAALDAHAKEAERTTRLAAIGAASRQEVERVQAAHVAYQADLERAASQLELLGWSRMAIEALRPGTRIDGTTLIGAPIDGVVTERTANVGLNVDTGTPLFTVVDLSRVWVIGDVYERDLARVRIGTPATVTPAAFPDRQLSGQVSYLDPSVNARTRTVRVRVEMPNPGGTLRLGMLATIEIGGRSAVALSVPRGALQQIGDQTVVYVVDPARPGTYIERSVRVTAGSGETRSVAAGLSAGDEVVIEGSFLLRAERERMGLPAPAPVASSASAPLAVSSPVDAQATLNTRVVVTELGFEPARVTLRAGAPTRLTFVRTTDATCATEVVIPALKERRALPLNQDVTITIPPRASGEVTFACGMNMLSGALVVQ